MRSITQEVRILVVVVVGIATVTFVILAREIAWKDWLQLAVFSACIVVASSFRLLDPARRQVTPSTVLTYLAIYLFNPPTVLLVVGTGRALGYFSSSGWIQWRVLFNGCQGGLSAALGAYAFAALGGDSSAAAVLVGPMVHQAANHLFVAVGVSKWRGTPFLDTWFSGIRSLFWPNFFSIATAFVLASLYKLHFAFAVAYLVLLPFQWRALINLYQKIHLIEQIVDGLVVATDANFPPSQGHARRVADLATAIAREMRLGQAALESIQLSSLLHDIGMIGKDDLLERGPSTPDDMASLSDHVRVGADIARQLPRREISDAILFHHERHDGSGYLSGVGGRRVPLAAKVIALAEVVDSMRSGIFPYRLKHSADAILARVMTERGRGFDPEVVDAFLMAVRSGTTALGETMVASEEIQGSFEDPEETPR